MANDRILTAEQEMKLRQPIDDYIGKIQAQIDGLRKDGTDQVVAIQNTIDGVKRDRSLTKGEREDRLGELRRQLEKAKAVEAKNKDEVSKLIDQGVSYLKEHFDKEYYQPVKESCAQEKVKAKEKYDKKIADWRKNTRKSSQNFLLIRKLRTRTMYTKTAGSMRRWSWKRITRRLRTEDMPPIPISIT